MYIGRRVDVMYTAGTIMFRYRNGFGRIIMSFNFVKITLNGLHILESLAPYNDC